MEWNIVIALVAAAGAGYAFWNSANKSRKAKEMGSWPSATARILEAHVEEVYGTDSDGRPELDYEPRIVYEYEIEGRNCQGKRFALEKDHFGSRRKAEQYLAKWPVGSEASVYVNPSDPSEAYLSREGGGGGWWVGVFLLVLAAAIALGAFDGDDDEVVESPLTEAAG